MEQIVVLENYAVGAFTFGMAEQQAMAFMQHYIEKYGLYERAFFFEYDDEGIICAIHLIIEALREKFQCHYRGIDLLHTSATNLIAHFEKIAPYIADNDAKHGFMYQFPTLGLTFWRGNVLTEADLETDWFKEQLPENQEDEKRFLYFETVTFYPQRTE